MHHHLGRPAAHLAGLDAALERLEPCLKITFSDILTLTPIRKSGFSASAMAQASTCALSML
jgi:hypothetical protein